MEAFIIIEILHLQCFRSRRSYGVVIFHAAATYTHRANNIAFFIFQQYTAGKGNKSAVGMLNIKQRFSGL